MSKCYLLTSRWLQCITCGSKLSSASVVTLVKHSHMGLGEQQGKRGEERMEKGEGGEKEKEKNSFGQLEEVKVDRVSNLPRVCIVGTGIFGR